MNKTLRVEWPTDMESLLRKTGEACTHMNPSKRPVSLVLSKVSGGWGRAGCAVRALTTAGLCCWFGFCVSDLAVRHQLESLVLHGPLPFPQFHVSS